MPKHLLFLIAIMTIFRIHSQKDWVQGNYYFEKGSIEPFCSERVENVVELSEKMSAYHEPPYNKQIGYRTCRKRVWTQKTFKGTVYQWNIFREEWEAVEAEGEFWIFYWAYYKERVF